MALIICPECGKKISDKALKCPACAYPIRKDSQINKNKNNKQMKFFKNKGIIILVSCVIVIFVLIALVGLLLFPKSILLHEESIILTVGEEYDIKYDIIPEKAIKGNIKMKSTNESVVSVNDNKISAESEGNCQIILSSWNGKSSQLKIEVISQKDNQKEHIKLLSDYIKENADLKGENNTSIKQIYSLENDEIFMLAQSDEGVCLMFQKNNSYGNDLTMVNLKSGDIREAQISDVSTFLFDGEKMSTSASGKISLLKYKFGDDVTINDVSSENTPSDFEIGVTDESQKRINEGVECAIKYFEQYLGENNKFGELSDYGFRLND